MPNSCAFFNLLPASSPATKKLVFLDTDDENFPEFFSIISIISSLLYPSNEPVTQNVKFKSLSDFFSFFVPFIFTPAFSNLDII